MHRRLRVALLIALVAAPLLAGGWLWLRNSSLVAVRDVRIVGARGADAPAIEAALTAAARRMSTLDVKTGELRAAVAAYPIVGAVEVRSSFPHSLSIRVIERPPVADLTVASANTAVAADGVVLGPAHVSGSLPSLAGTTPLSAGQRVHDPTLLAALSVLGAAPTQLASDVARAYGSPKGLTLAFKGGLLAYFGDATRPHAKWLSLARVLADASSAGASYVDVRVPERPAAGFPAGVAPPPSGGTEAEAEGATATHVSSESGQALAEGLRSAVGGGASSSSSSAASGHEETSSGEHEASHGEHEASSSGEPASAASEASGVEAKH